MLLVLVAPSAARQSEKFMSPAGMVSAPKMLYTVSMNRTCLSKVNGTRLLPWICAQRQRSMFTVKLSVTGLTGVKLHAIAAVSVVHCRRRVHAAWDPLCIGRV